jgi:hypothetical protein
LTEPPDADPHVRWCGRGAFPSPYPDYLALLPKKIKGALTHTRLITSFTYTFSIFPCFAEQAMRLPVLADFVPQNQNTAPTPRERLCSLPHEECGALELDRGLAY